MCLRGDPRPQRVYVVLSNAHTLVHGEKPGSAVNASCAVYGEATRHPLLSPGAGHLTAGVNPAMSASPCSWRVVETVERLRASMTTCAHAIGHGQPTLCATVSYRWLVIVYAVQLTVATRRQMEIKDRTVGQRGTMSSMHI